MQKISTMRTSGKTIFKGQLTIGLDLGAIGVRFRVRRQRDFEEVDDTGGIAWQQLPYELLPSGRDIHPINFGGHVRAPISKQRQPIGTPEDWDKSCSEVWDSARLATLDRPQHPTPRPTVCSGRERLRKSSPQFRSSFFWSSADKIRRIVCIATSFVFCF